MKFHYKRIRTNLKRFRNTSGLNQTDFWGQFGVTQSGGSRYENDRVLPKQLTALIRLQYPQIR